MAPTERTEPAEILLVEDNPDDVELTRRALRTGKVTVNLHVVHDGEDAMAFLRNKGGHTAAPRPDLLLLDLNMPRMGGKEVLAEMKDDEDLRRIPVVVLTTSQAEQDILESYDLHAACYVTKPVDFEQFTHVIRTLDEFWFTVVKLPPS